ncbi:MAG: TetR/AcrR family transcriptional regulator, partial [Pseudonocardia sp.]
MTDRRTEILDGALHVLAEHGMRGLTHRAVDAAARIPPGSASYYFRSRSALVAGCVTRLVEIDLAVEIPAVLDAGPAKLLDVLTGFGVAMAT